VGRRIVSIAAYLAADGAQVLVVDLGRRATPRAASARHAHRPPLGAALVATSRWPTW
jgi:hypothetical protein